MKLFRAAVLVGLLVSAAAGELPTCGAGYENQMMDEDSLGYCTRIPSLKEEADRAEAFLKRGIPSFMYSCEVANHLSSKCMTKRDEALAHGRVESYRTKIEGMGLHAMQSVGQYGNPEYIRLMAAIQKIQDAAKECSKK
jgi:hypothetical protein